jgi:DNA-binding MurR/RpiR family transcriptional regulator/8-oxo-dGTP pyrophosphatase MutT (NUDIX family)
MIAESGDEQRTAAAVTLDAAALRAYRPERLYRPDLVRCGVLVPLIRRSNGDYFVLTVRNDQLRFQPGDVSFPGGKANPGEFDLRLCALRETEEEIGLSPSDVEIIGELDQINVAGRYLVTPFVGLVHREASIAAAPDEVAQLIELSASDVLASDAFKITSEVRDGTTRTAYTFVLGKIAIRGATARMLKRLLEIGYGMRYHDWPSQIRSPPEFAACRNATPSDLRAGAASYPTAISARVAHGNRGETVRQARRKHAAVDPFTARLRAAESSLSPTASRVVRFIDQHRLTALASSASKIAASTATSDATVIRAIQAIGFEGMANLRQALATTLEGRPSIVDDMHRTLTDVNENADQAIDFVLKTHQEGISTLRSSAMRPRFKQAIAALHRARRIMVFGIGPTAALAHYTTTLLNRSGRRARALDATGTGLADQLLDCRDGDALLVLAYGQPYREVVITFTEAKRLGLTVVLVTDSLDNKLAHRADVIVPAPRGSAHRVALHGSTLVALEAMVLGLAALDSPRAIVTLERLDELRKAFIAPSEDQPI